MQKFSYHSHTSFNNIFDGRNTADEMLAAYEKKGFTEVGISNHCFCHPTLNPPSFPQFFYDVDKFLDVYKVSFDYIDEAASKHNIKVIKGLEVDYFPSAKWNKIFERIIKELKPEYLIGSTHFIRTADESFMCNIYQLDSLPSLSTEEKNELLRNYWINVEHSIKSGYFDFIAHPDYCCQFDLAITAEWNETKYRVIDAFSSTKTPCEINTGGIERIKRPFPDWWIVQELINRNVPLLISDDAHTTDAVGRHFDEVEKKLTEMGCENRFSFNK